MVLVVVVVVVVVVKLVVMAAAREATAAVVVMAAAWEATAESTRDGRRKWKSNIPTKCQIHTLHLLPSSSVSPRRFRSLRGS